MSYPTHEMKTPPGSPRGLGLLGLTLLTVGPLAAQTLTSNGGTLFVNGGGTLTVNGTYQQAGGALLRTDSTTRVVGDVQTTSGTALDLGTGTLDVTGNVSSAATVSGSTGTLRLSGTGAQTLDLGAATVPKLTVDKPSGTATLNKALTIRRALTMAGTGGLSTGGRALTLLSDATGAALLANMGTSTVTGAVTVQRYLGLGWATATFRRPPRARTSPAWARAARPRCSIRPTTAPPTRAR